MKKLLDAHAKTADERQALSERLEREAVERRKIEKTKGMLLGKLQAMEAKLIQARAHTGYCGLLPSNKKYAYMNTSVLRCRRHLSFHWPRPALHRGHSPVCVMPALQRHAVMHTSINMRTRESPSNPIPLPPGVPPTGLAIFCPTGTCEKTGWRNPGQGSEAGGGTETSPARA